MKLLMVCLGNICRSPLAQGIMDHLIKENHLGWTVDSAGTSNWHVGGAPDPRSIAIAQLNGIDISHQQARQFVVEDYDSFDLILAMDQSNYNHIIAMAPDDSYHHKVDLIMNFLAPGRNIAVPDPYYDDGFDEVFTMLENACKEIVQKEYKT